MDYKVQLCYFHHKYSHSPQMSSYPKRETKSIKWKAKLKENHERKKKCFQATICIMPWIHPLFYSFLFNCHGINISLLLFYTKIQYNVWYKQSAFTDRTRVVSDLWAELCIPFTYKWRKPEAPCFECDKNMPVYRKHKRLWSFHSSLH